MNISFWKWICCRKNFKLLSGAGLFWLFWSQTLIFDQWVFHAILPGSLPRATIKRRGNILSPSSMQAFQAGQICPVFPFSLPHWLAAGRASQHDRAHILSLHFLAAGRTSQHETTFTLLHWFSLTYFEQSTKHPEETSSNLWTIGAWEIILSSFLFDQRILRETNWIFFNSCFDFSILIPVLTTASQFMLWHSAFLFFLNSTFAPLLPVTYSTRVPFVSSC